jgi:hypothetical protein
MNTLSRFSTSILTASMLFCGSGCKDKTRRTYTYEEDNTKTAPGYHVTLYITHENERPTHQTLVISNLETKAELWNSDEDADGTWETKGSVNAYKDPFLNTLQNDEKLNRLAREMVQ